MKRLRNTNPIGAVSIPALGIDVESGGEFDCPNDVAANLLEQAGNYSEVKKGDS